MHERIFSFAERQQALISLSQWEYPFVLLNKMASPQLEKGYTKIANEILEKLAFAGINGSEYRIINVVIRKTYGFQKKKDMISLTQFQKATQMDRKQVVETIKSLVGKRILLKENNTYIFNKNWEEWVVGKRTLGGQKHTGGGGQKTTKSSGQKHTHKRKKEIETKEITEQSSGIGINKVISLFKEVNPSYKLFFARPPQRSAVERMLETHGEELLTRVISFLPRSNSMAFLPTITTPIKLEERWADLEAGIKKIKNKQLSNSRGLEV